MIEDKGNALISNIPSENNSSGEYKLFQLKNLIQQKPTQQALAIEVARLNFSIFPCDFSKAPIVDPSLGFVHGYKDATKDLRLIAQTWHRYPEAAIGLAIPKDLIIFDLDVLKDAEKRPILRGGRPIITGLKSFQSLILDLNFSDSDLDTLTVKTQSGGRHIFYRMPEGIPSFSHTHAMEGLDLKGHGGYVILPNSQGQYGRYEFLNLTEIRPIPEDLLKWSLELKNLIEEFKKLPAGTTKVNREEIVRILTPYWKRADGKRNRLTSALSGYIFRSGGTEDDAHYIIFKMCALTGKGHEHISTVKYSFHSKGRILGFTTLKQTMEEIANAEK